MIHLYIISLVLSSFFTYTAVAEESLPLQYAFFIPENSLRNNTDVQDIRRMRPRYAKTEESSSSAESYSKSPSVGNRSGSGNVPTTGQLGKKTTLPVEKIQAVAIKRQTPKSLPQKESSPETSVNPEKSPFMPTSDAEKIAEKLKDYRLDDSPARPVVATDSQAKPDESALSELEKLRQKDLSELLAAIPYPDSKQPKFRQLYDNYGLEMRIMQRRGDFPDNPEQEETLAKANSLRRFKVR